MFFPNASKLEQEENKTKKQEEGKKIGRGMERKAGTAYHYLIKI